MGTSSNFSKRLKPRGTLGNNEFYIERSADDDLFGALQYGDFCFVLAPRQIGKSSLCLHTARRLMQESVHCAQIDLTLYGKPAGQSPVDAWYDSLTRGIARELTIPDPTPFLLNHRQLLPAERFCSYLEQEVLRLLPGRIVIFFDEIDFLRVLQIDRDAFFIAIRALYNRRAQCPDLARLTFCLLGVAAPRDLVTSPDVTPFNIGHAVQLLDFTYQQILAFSPALTILPGDCVKWLEEIYSWTSGHPSMTQALCESLIRVHVPLQSRGIAEQVKDAVNKLFLLGGRSRDDSVGYAEKRLEQRENQAELLALYLRILQGNSILFDGGDPVQQELQLSGMVAPRLEPEGKSFLRVRNRIFAEILNHDWVGEKEEKRPLTRAYRRWETSGKSSKFLIRGTDLAVLSERAKAHPNEVTAGENAFLTSCWEEAHHQEEEARTRSQRIVVIVLAVATFLFLLLSIGLSIQYRRAEKLVEQAQRAGSEAQNRALSEEDAKTKAQRALVALAESERVTKTTLRAEKSLRAALLAVQPELQTQAMFVGMQAVLPDRDAAISALWEGINRASERVTLPTILPEHPKAVWFASFSPDGQRIVTACRDGIARIWDSHSGRHLVSLKGHTASIWSAVFSPDGKRVLTASFDHTAQLWDAKTGNSILVLPQHEDDVWSAVFSPDGSRIATASNDRTALLWDAESGQVLFRLSGHVDHICAVAFSPDGRRIVTASDDDTAIIWDAHEGRQLRTLVGHTDSVKSAVFSPDGKQIATASSDRTVRLWSATDEGQHKILKGHIDGVRSVAFSPDGQRIVTASDDLTARLWDVNDGSEIRIFSGHSGWVTSASFSPDGRWVVTSSKDSTVRIWDTEQGQFLVNLKGHADWVRSAAFSPDGARIVTASADHTVRVWDARLGTSIQTLAGHSRKVWAAQFSPDGQRIVTAGEDRLAFIWDAMQGRRLLRLHGHKEWIRSATFSPDGKYVVTASVDGTARIWELNHGKSVHRLKGHTDALWSAQFSSDGKRIVTASADHTARVWDVEQETVVATLEGHADSVRFAAFSPNDQLIVTASADRTAGVWDAVTGRLIHSLKGHTGNVSSAAFFPNSQWIVTASDDHTVRMWDAVQGTFLLHLRGHEDSVFSVSVSPNGRNIVTASADKTALVHPIDPRDLYAFGCKFLRTLHDHPDAPEAAVREILATCPPP